MVHPLLARHGFEYEQTIVWDKGVAHIAGNVNGATIRRFPVVTEVCVLSPAPSVPYRPRPSAAARMAPIRMAPGRVAIFGGE